MKTLRHGDIGFIKINELPKGAKSVYKGHNYIVALGEVTGHKHVMESPIKETLVKTPPIEVFETKEGLRFIQITEQPARLTHEEHKMIEFVPGIYKVSQEKEYDYYKKMQQQVWD